MCKKYRCHKSRFATFHSIIEGSLDAGAPLTNGIGCNNLLMIKAGKKAIAYLSQSVTVCMRKKAIAQIATKEISVTLCNNQRCCDVINRIIIYTLSKRLMWLEFVGTHFWTVYSIVEIFYLKSIFLCHGSISEWSFQANKISKRCLTLKFLCLGKLKQPNHPCAVKYIFPIIWLRVYDCCTIPHKNNCFVFSIRASCFVSIFHTCLHHSLLKEFVKTFVELTLKQVFQRLPGQRGGLYISLEDTSSW